MDFFCCEISINNLGGVLIRCRSTRSEQTLFIDVRYLTGMNKPWFILRRLLNRH
jgi:hypothetical protein